MSSVWTTAFLTGAAAASACASRKCSRAQGAPCRLRPQDQRRHPPPAQRPGAGSVFHEVDVRDAEGLEAAVRTAVTEVGPPQLAINSAGVQRTKVFEELTARISASSWTSI